jgi:16S rRNA G966 N2-methylase RsmD
MNVTVMLGDSREVLPTLGLFDLVITDPPYSTAQGHRSGGASWSGRRRRKAPFSIPEYAMTEDVVAIVAEAARHVSPKGRMVVVSGSFGGSVTTFIDAVRPILPLARVLSWCRPNSKDGAIGPFGWTSKTILLFGKNGGAPHAEDTLILDRHYRRPLSGETREHPAEMPAGVGRWLAKGLVRRHGTSVLDPFVGTGALLQGFLESGCNVTGIDIDARWVRLAETRLRSVHSPVLLFERERERETSMSSRPAMGGMTE